MGSVPNFSPELLFCAWGTGEIVWKDESKMAKTRYLSSNAGATVVRGALSRLDAMGAFSPLFTDELTEHVGPESDYTNILVKHEGRALHLISWHEQFELEPGLAATARGIAVLEKETQMERMLREPQAYIFFRWLWNELRLSARAITPSSGEPVAGELYISREGVFWCSQKKE